MHRGGLAGQNLGRHVLWRSGQGQQAVFGVTLTRLLAQAEIHQDDPAAFFAHDVLGLDVAVDQPGTMHGPQRAANVPADQRGLLGAHAAVLAQNPVEVLTVDEIHPHAYVPFVFGDAKDGHHVLMAQAGEQAGFGNNGGIQFLGGIPGAQELEGDFTFESQVPGSVHHAEASDSDAFADL